MFPRSGATKWVLDVAASAKAVCFDNVRTRLKSEELECFLTSAERRFRVLGTNVMQVVENRCVVFVTTSEPILSGALRAALPGDSSPAPHAGARQRGQCHSFV